MSNHFGRFACVNRNMTCQFLFKVLRKRFERVEDPVEGLRRLHVRPAFQLTKGYVQIVEQNWEDHTGIIGDVRLK